MKREMAKHALWTPADLETLRALADAGASPLRIAAKLKRSVSFIRNIARQHGIKIKTTKEVRRSYGLGPQWTSNRNF
jgi:hypothetical protein